ncbi:hypothetical protein AB0M79_18265 [Polymorphospora sp. NPDC051019]|uniref:hypothetical protein n=1 Tax=Polymorphospora sp. NPDC051019 TaxID=3155725 RepID=UPI00342C903D
MRTVDIALIAGGGVAAGLFGVIGIAILARSRHRADAILWRGRRLSAPRLLGLSCLFIGLATTVQVMSRLFFDLGSRKDGFMFMVGAAFVVAAGVTFVMWLLQSRRSPANNDVPK